MKKRKSLKRKLTSVNAIIFIITAIVFSLVSIYSINISTDNALENTVVEIAKQAANNVDKQLEAFSVLFTEIADNPTLTTTSGAMINKTNYLKQKNDVYGNKYNCTIDVIYTSAKQSLMKELNVKEYDFYKKAFNGYSSMSNPFKFSELEDKLVFVYSMPIKSNNSIVGVLFVTFDYNTIYDIVEQTQIGKTGAAYLLGKDGYVIAHKNQSLVNVSNSYEESKTDKNQEKIGELEKRASNGETGYGEYSWEKVTKIAAFSTVNEELGWSIFVTAEKSEFTAQIAKSTIMTIFIAVLLGLISSILFFIISNGITRPIISMINRMELLAQGDLSTPIPEVNSGDETQLLHTSVQNTIESLKGYITNIDYVMSEIANNNLNLDIDIEYKGDFVTIKDSLNKIIEDLNNNFRNITQVSDQVANGANQISAGAQQLSQGATEQASSLEELSATINEVSENINLNSAETINANNLTEKALVELQKGNNEMKEMLKSMDEIKISSNEISKIIKLIEDIAFQTNILSLNAAVEAARAGVAGKGFSVVADEVRNLASKSAEAAKNTTILIDKALSAVSNGIEIADVTASSLSIAVELSQNVSNIMNKITANSNELTVSISQILEGTEQISSVVQTNSATAEESAASSEELSGQATILKEMIEKYNLKRDISLGVDQ